ncbi:unannotated protein [freshwater metagenome]|uniref:Unannotated protein n=1 Tax=freshwater metagenome TaxID=449393 RepID=A0A6J6TCR2_9ZZZZ|nr:hypothetical protein [Actinomycetota bacterium]MSY16413.1 hypothetical protein [Actinomycetota bacterium]MSY97648.1 hypothetical protein [Actinomycetota bacterium]
MPGTEVNSPVSSAPTDRLALGISLVRPGVAGIDAALNPSSISEGYSTCFEGN